MVNWFYFGPISLLNDRSYQLSPTQSAGELQKVKINTSAPNCVIAGPLPINSRTIEAAEMGLQSCIAGENIRHRPISGVPLCGQLGGYICLLILYNIKVCKGSPKLDIDLHVCASEFILQGKSKHATPQPYTMRSVTLFHLMAV